MATARDLVSGALRLLGVIAQGETPGNAEMSEGISALNGMLSNWSTENLTVPTRTREEFDLVGGQQTYTVGPGETTDVPPVSLYDFDTIAPVSIDNAGLIMSDGTTELPIGIIRDRKEWAQLVVKSLTSSLPSKIFFETTTPFTVEVWPIPTDPIRLVLYSLKPLPKFKTANDTVSLPDFYERAIRYNLALELAPEYGRDPSAMVMQTANESKANIKRINFRPSHLKFDSGLNPGASRFNVLTGEWS